MSDVQSVVLGLAVCWLVPQLLLAAGVVGGLWFLWREDRRASENLGRLIEQMRERETRRRS